MESLRVTQEGVDRVLRWSADRSGILTVFFTTPIQGPNALVLIGSLSTPDALPLVVVRDAEVAQSGFRVYRRPTVRVR